MIMNAKKLLQHLKNTTKLYDDTTRKRGVRTTVYITLEYEVHSDKFIIIRNTDTAGEPIQTEVIEEFKLGNDEQEQD